MRGAATKADAANPSLRPSPCSAKGEGEAQRTDELVQPWRESRLNPRRIESPLTARETRKPGTQETRTVDLVKARIEQRRSDNTGKCIEL